MHGIIGCLFSNFSIVENTKSTVTDSRISLFPLCVLCYDMIGDYVYWYSRHVNSLLNNIPNDEDQNYFKKMTVCYKTQCLWVIN